MITPNYPIRTWKSANLEIEHTGIDYIVALPELGDPDTICCDCDLVDRRKARRTQNIMYTHCGNSFEGNQQFFQNQLLILKYCGLWNPYEALDSSQNNKNASKRYAAFAVSLLSFFYYLFLVTELLYMFKPTGEKDLSKAFFVSATGYKMLFKVYYLLFQRKEYRTLVNDCRHSMALRPRNKEEEKFFTSALTLSKTFLNMFLICGYGAIGFWVVVPFYKFYFDGSPWTFPVAAWFPYTDTYTSVFWIIYIYITISSFIVANMTVALSSFEFTFFCHMNACIQTLSSRLTKIGTSTNKSVLRRPNGRSKAYEDIVYLVKHHLLVKRYIQQCEKLTQASIFAEISFSSLIICMTTFRIVTQQDTGIEFISTVSYLGAMIIQIYQFCFVGNILTYSSNELGNSAFFSDFRKFDKQTSQVFLILLNDLQQEINVSTGGPLKIKLNIETFLKVMKTSYSFLAVLKAVDS